MEANSDTRFDRAPLSKVAAGLLLELAHERSLKSLMEKVFVRFAMGRPGIARFEFWLIEKGDICSRCAQRAVCPDQARCLHLAAEASRSASGGAPQVRFDDPDARIPLGVGIVGQIAVTGEKIVLRDVDKDPCELAGIDWLKREQIRGFVGTAVSYQDEILGVVTSFGRVKLPDDAPVWQQIFADHIAGAVANARAFEEIERLKAQLEIRNAYLEEEVVEAKAFGDLVGQSAPLRHIINQMDLVAPTDASVLILGETGTGKELVAREIHRRSARKDKPLVRVNCASIPKELFESEFFGHVRGSFTGAIKDRSGRFETAEGGTLFLDEIGEVPLDMQGKLLRVLQEKRYERVGEDRTRTADVRIVAATNRDLKQAVAVGRFREDLFYRLNVFPIQVPPLRERLDDIPSLAKHFVELSVKDLKCAKPRLTRAGVVKLQSYDWPGNVRELRNVIERAVILARGGSLEFDLPTAPPPAPMSKPRPESQAAESDEPEFLTETELQLRERDNLLRILQKANWKIKGPDGAAELLGVKPTTLLSRIDKWGLKKPAAS